MNLDQISSLLQVILVDLVLAGDNAVVVGMVAATVATDQRRRVILIGIAMAALMRIGFALIAVQLLQLNGLMLIGGLLLLWVAWKLWRDLHLRSNTDTDRVVHPNRSIGHAMLHIALADLSMSLDNVLAVAGVAHDHPIILAIGLGLSIALMAIAATVVARALERYRWIAYLGLAVILWVAMSLIWTGVTDLQPHLGLS
jgi:YjbE family integral membrane protein